jgi:hypothetical protein
MLAVLMIFLLPFGGGIPAGVLLARTKGLAWPTTAGLYFASDLILALFFEPGLRLAVAWGRKVDALARFSGAIRTALARGAAHFRGREAGPLALVLIAFGVDPMTGRAAALAAGHGPLAGWVLAIAGDMLYFAVVALAILRLTSHFGDPNKAVLVVLGAMILVPLLVRQFRSAQRPAP